MGQARKSIGKRDPDDVEILALALHFQLPLWSTDTDSEVTNIDWYTTAELLRIRKESSPRPESRSSHRRGQQDQDPCNGRPTSHPHRQPAANRGIPCPRVARKHTVAVQQQRGV